MRGLLSKSIGEEAVGSLKRDEPLLLPGSLFFIEVMELPEDVEEGEVGSYIELSLEGGSPFPLEQMMWGYLHYKGSSRAVVYAAYMESVSEEAVEVLEDVVHVMPSWVPSLCIPVEKAGVYFYEARGVLSAVGFEEGGGLPKFIRSVVIEEGDVEGARSELVKDGDFSGLEVMAGVWSLEKVRVNGKGGLVCRLEGPGGKHKGVLSGANEFLWHADLRDAYYIKEKRKSIKLSKFLWKSAITAACFLVGLVALHSMYFAAQGYVGKRREQLAVEAPLVAKIESQNDLVFKIEDIAQEYRSPLSELATINALRPDKVYFTAFSRTVDGKVKVEGAGADANQVNAYVKKLADSPAITKAELEQIVSRQGKALFTLNVEFLNGGGAS